MFIKYFVKVVCVIMILVLFGSCATSTMVKIYTTEENGKPINDATVTLNGQVVGQTPNAQMRISNFAGTNPQFTIYKEGYNVVRKELVKEVKPRNVIFGLLMNVFAWLWVYGPKPYQEIIMTPETVEEAAPAPETTE